jgi:hypothetical protein
MWTINPGSGRGDGKLDVVSALLATTLGEQLCVHCYAPIQARRQELASIEF